jgi:hypothetical protein
MPQETENKNEVFYGFPVETLIKAIHLLEECGKAQVSNMFYSQLFYSENTDSYGVKFFHL